MEGRKAGARNKQSDRDHQVNSEFSLAGTKNLEEEVKQVAYQNHKRKNSKDA